MDLFVFDIILHRIGCISCVDRC